MIKTYTLEDYVEWDRIVKSFNDYDVYWLSGYVKAFQINGDGYPILVFYSDENGLRGINVVMRRDISDCPFFSSLVEKNSYYDLSTPYGYGGWLIEGNCDSIYKLFNEYFAWCQNNNIVSEFVRFHPSVNNYHYCLNHYEVVTLGEVVSMDIKDSETIWKNFTSKNRNMIRKAIKNNVVVFNGRTPECFDNFMSIYNQTMKRDNAEDYYFFKKNFYSSIMNDLDCYSQVFYAVKDGKTIASTIIIGANKKLYYHLSGSLKEYNSLAPTNLILYKTALWGSANGYNSLILGGGVGSEEDSLLKFKKSFYRGELNRFHIGKKVFLQEKYDDLVRIRRHQDEISYTKFFPLYRAE